MMASSNGKIFRVTDPLWEESTGHRSIPLLKDQWHGLRCFLRGYLNQTVVQNWSAGRETPLWSWWRHCNDVFPVLQGSPYTEPANDVCEYTPEEGIPYKRRLLSASSRVLFPREGNGGLSAASRSPNKEPCSRPGAWDVMQRLYPSHTAPASPGSTETKENRPQPVPSPSCRLPTATVSPLNATKPQTEVNNNDPSIPPLVRSISAPASPLQGVTASEARWLHVPPKKRWLPRSLEYEGDVLVTDVTCNCITVTFLESPTEKGFFKDSSWALLYPKETDKVTMTLKTNVTSSQRHSDIVVTS